MSTPFSTTLLDRFQRNGLMRLKPDQFLLAVRRMGANFSAKECACVVKLVGTDAEGFVNIHGFCEWFRDIEKLPRFRRSTESASSSDSNNLVVAENSTSEASQSSATRSESENVTQLSPIDEDAAGGPAESAVEGETNREITLDVPSEVGEDKADASIDAVRMPQCQRSGASVVLDPQIHSSGAQTSRVDGPR
eukprot:TRINITY_DN26097_c0_g1_i1.p1 TRINITY_DN26097_c0_g1~~TRINITY_DN26097_c0_g1_i1.p1  ORF type:complete len:206 (-),score=32.35 TRINITY_DN26097_c0_g1_i1:385-963(-)